MNTNSRIFDVVLYSGRVVGTVTAVSVSEAKRKACQIYDLAERQFTVEESDRTTAALSKFGVSPL